MYIEMDVDSTQHQYDQIVPLEGAEYLFDFLWSEKESCWYLILGDQDGTPIASGIKLVVSWPLLRRFVDPRLPRGLLYCADMSGQKRDVEVATDLGTRVLLIYITSDDRSDDALANINPRRPG